MRIIVTNIKWIAKNPSKLPELIVIENPSDDMRQDIFNKNYQSESIRNFISERHCCGVESFKIL